MLSIAAAITLIFLGVVLLVGQARAYLQTVRVFGRLPIRIMAQMLIFGRYTVRGITSFFLAIAAGLLTIIYALVTLFPLQVTCPFSELLLTLSVLLTILTFNFFCSDARPPSVVI